MAYISEYPPAHNDTYVKSTSNYTTYYPYLSTNPAASLTGGIGGSWLTANVTSQRFHIDLGSSKVITRVYYENAHDSGSSTDAGIKEFTFWGTDNAAAFAELTYATDTNWTQLSMGAAQFDIHISADQADPKYITASNITAYRYYAFKIVNNWGNASQLSVRRITLQSGGAQAGNQVVNLSDYGIF